MKDDGEDSLGVSMVYQYTWSFLNIAAGFIYYVFLMHYASTTVVGAVALLSALISILSTVFSLSINSGTSHFIAFHVGSGNYGSARRVIRTSLALSTVMSFIALLFMLIHIHNILPFIWVFHHH